MYSALNEDLLLQEIRDRRATLRASYAGGATSAATSEGRRWWRRGARRTR